MEFAAMLFGIQVGAGLFVGGIGMGFLHMHLANKGYRPRNIAMISVGTLAISGAGMVELAARSETDLSYRNQVRGLGMFPFFLGLGGFILGYSGTLICRRIIFFGKNHLDKYIQDTVAKKKIEDAMAKNKDN